jgi:hypothetical protein
VHDPAVLRTLGRVCQQHRLADAGVPAYHECLALAPAHGPNQRIERRTLDAPAEHPLREGTGQLSGIVAVLGCSMGFSEE